jgi:hypothetical protein
MTISVEVTKISVSPNECPLQERLRMEMEFSVSESLEGSWEYKYMVDMTNKRKIIGLRLSHAHPHAEVLGKSEQKVYSPGSSYIEIFEVGCLFPHLTTKCPSIDIAGLKPSALLNTGLMLACLMKGEEEVMQVSLVTQISSKDGAFFRTMYSPLD